jgi:hypothetical protein
LTIIFGNGLLKVCTNLFIRTICGLLLLIVLSFSAIVKKYSLKS